MSYMVIPLDSFRNGGPCAGRDVRQRLSVDGSRRSSRASSSVVKSSTNLLGLSLVDDREWSAVDGDPDVVVAEVDTGLGAAGPSMARARPVPKRS